MSVQSAEQRDWHGLDEGGPIRGPSPWFQTYYSPVSPLARPGTVHREAINLCDQNVQECELVLSDELERLQTALAGKYEIERELGQGGMAIVYLAQDVKHERKVAIKVLRAELAASLGADRFVREIKTTANLQHPHILPLYDSGEADGFLFYVMPFVEGESLGDLVKREKQLPLEDALRYTREVADALHYAHERGIVHRDIKPDNIMITGGHAVVADFGIAGAVTAAGGNKLTQTGMAVGTPAYMAPEQAVGQEVDGRADIYSLACALYEMLVGEIPFTGNTPQAVMARHAMEEVPRPSIVRNTVPTDLEEAILCAMNKAPADRFKTAAEFSEALAFVDTATATHRRPTATTTVYKRPGATQSRGLAIGLSAVVVVAVGVTLWQLLPTSDSGTRASGIAGLDPNSVAVLYFEDLTPGGELTYLADGITEGLIDQLSQVRELDVISRNGVEPYRGGAVSRDSIARALRVGSLIEGSVEKIGERVRVATRLVDGNSGTEFDRAGFELPADDLLAIRDSATRATARLFRERLGEEVRLRELRASTANVDAWSLVQRGERLRKDAERLIESDSTEAGLLIFDQADSVLALAESADPQWIVAPTLRSEIAYRRSRLAHDQRSTFDWVDVGLAHANRALEIDPNAPRALELRGTVQYWAYLNDREPDPEKARDLLYAAKGDLEKATEVDPTLASAYATLSHLYYQTDDGTTSVVLAAERAYREDAYLTVAQQVLHRLFLGNYDLEQFSQAQRWCNTGAERFADDPRFKECQLWIQTTPIGHPNVEEAWRIWNDMVPEIPEPDREYQSRWAKMIVGGILARAGLADSARSVLESARLTPDKDPLRELSWLEAYMRVVLGDHDEAIRLLKQFLIANPRDDPGPEAKLYWWWRDLQGHPELNEVRAALVV